MSKTINNSNMWQPNQTKLNNIPIANRDGADLPSTTVIFTFKKWKWNFFKE